MKSLYKYVGAIPFLLAVFVNATIDLGHKITLQNSLFKLYDGSEQILLTAIVNGLILLPFILLLTPAGLVSDRFPKHAVLRGSACAALGLTCLITCFYWLGWFWPAFVTTFLLAAQSAIFSPAKYSYLKLLFGKNRLAEANGLHQSVTIVAILAGTFLYSIVFEIVFPESATDPNDVIKAMVPAGAMLIGAALFEVILTFRLPKLDTESTDVRFAAKDYLSGKLTRNSLSVIFQHKNLRLSILGLSMFWGLGQVLLASYPAYAKEFIGIKNTILIQGTLACTGIGIAIGSAVAGRISRGYIETGLIPLGALGLTVGLWFVPNITSAAGEVICFLAVGFFGGLFIVPLYALVQFYANDDQMGQVMAGNNWVQNLVMFSLLVLVSVAAASSFTAKSILLFAAAFAVVGSIFTVAKLPQSLARFLLSALIQRRYSVSVEGMKNIPEEKGVLLLGNHVSWMDWAIVQIACPRPIHFVMAKSIYDRWYLKSILRFFGCIPIAPGSSSQEALEKVATLLNDGQVVCLFPEGTLSRTGHLVEFKRGFERACELASDDVQIVPFYLRGLWGSQLSFAQGNLKQSAGAGVRREIIVGFGQPLPKNIDAASLKQKIFDLSTHTWQAYAGDLQSLASGCVAGLKRAGTKTVVVDSENVSYSGAKILAASNLCATKMKQSNGKAIGLLLPMSPAALIANVASQMANKPAVNLNYTSSQKALLAAIKASGVKHVYTSKKFLHKLSERGFDFHGLDTDFEFIYMEELFASFGKFRSFASYFAARCLPASYFQARFGYGNRTEGNACLLFSSGSESTPKGIQLSHRNIMANIKQISEVLDPQKDEVLMASLPPFHALGLTVCMFMPLVEGIKFVCQPDTTNAKSTAKLIAKNKATMLFGSSTLLRLYIQDKSIEPLMLKSLRMVIAGAEKLRETVAQGFKLKFGLEILEGYGATETSPVASVNIPNQLSADAVRVQRGSRPGSVGMPLPGTSFKIVDPDTQQDLKTDEEGMVLISGPQVMAGYLNDPEKTTSVMHESDGINWYVTGDKGRIDEDGFLWIVDRYSRFAKVGGEMISLGSVETLIQKALDQASHADESLSTDIEILVTTNSSEKKGEGIVLLSTAAIDLVDLRKRMLELGATAMMLPSKTIEVDNLPKLGSGKPDYLAAKQIADNEVCEGLKTV